MFNLYDLTNGNYRVFRAVSYPDYPESVILFDAEVEADESEWATRIYLNGTYGGPTDVVAARDYEIRWTIDDRKLLESGTVELELASGGRLAQSWSSIIAPVMDSDERPAVFDQFPSEGEVGNVSISPFEVDGTAMSYEWEGALGRLGR